MFEGKSRIIFLIVITLFAFITAQAEDRDNDGAYESSYDKFSTQNYQHNPVVLDTGDVVHSIPTPGNSCQGITWDGEYLWVSDITSDRIYQISPVDGSVQNSFAAPGGHIEGLAWDGYFIWAAENGGSNLEIDYLYGIDPEDGTVVHSFTMPTSWVHGITFDGGYIWGNDFATNMVYKMDLPGLAILDSIPTPGDRSIGVTFDGIYLWVDDFTTDLLYQIDLNTHEVLRTVPAPHDNIRDITWDGEYIWGVTWVTDLCYQVDVGGAPTSVDTELLLPGSFNLLGNYPNPFNASTNIGFELNQNSQIRIDIYNQLGQHVRTLVDKDFLAGKHNLIWNGDSDNGNVLSSGMYYYNISNGSEILSGDMILIK